MCFRPLVSVSAAITLPRADNDWLIRLLSSCLSPVASAALNLSEKYEHNKQDKMKSWIATVEG